MLTSPAADGREGQGRGGDSVQEDDGWSGRQKVRWLRYYLFVFGIANVITSFSIPLFFGDLLLWQPRNLPTELMVGSLYLAMGVIMLLAARDPLQHQAFLDFVILANLFHALVMLFYAEQAIQIVLDGGFIGLMALVPLLLYPWGIKNFLRYPQPDRSR